MSEKNKNNRNNLWGYKFKPLDVLTENDETLSSPPPEFTEHDFFQSEEWMNDSGIDFILDHEPLLCNLEEEVQFFIEDIKEHMKYLNSINISLKSQLKYQTQFSDKIERKYEESISLNNSLGEFIDQLKDEVELNKQRCERFQIENVILRKEIRILKEALDKQTGGANPTEDSSSLLGNNPTSRYKRFKFEERTPPCANPELILERKNKSLDLDLEPTPFFGKADSTLFNNDFHKDSMIIQDHDSHNCCVEGDTTDHKIARTYSCTNLAASENQDEGNGEDGDVEIEKKNSSIDLAAAGAIGAVVDIDTGEDVDVQIEKKNSSIDLAAAADINAAGVDADTNAIGADVDIDTGEDGAIDIEKKNSSIDLAAAADVNAAGVGADNVDVAIGTGENGDVDIEKNNSSIDLAATVDDDNAAGVEADTHSVGADDVDIDVDTDAAAVDINAAAVDDNTTAVGDNAADVDADTDVTVAAADVDVDTCADAAVGDVDVDDADADAVEAVPSADGMSITKTLGDNVVQSADTRGHLVNAYNTTDNTNEAKNVNDIEEDTEGKNTVEEDIVDYTQERKQSCTDLSATAKDYGGVDDVVNETSSGKLDHDLNKLEGSDDDEDSVEDIKLERKTSFMDLAAVAATEEGVISAEQKHKADIVSEMPQTVTGAVHFKSASKIHAIAQSVHSTDITSDVSNTADKDNNKLIFGVATATDTNGVEKHESTLSRFPEEIKGNKAVITCDTQKYRTHHKKSVLKAPNVLTNVVIVMPRCGPEQVSDSSTEVMEDHSLKLLERSSSLFLRPAKSRETSPEKLPTEKQEMAPLLIRSSSLFLRPAKSRETSPEKLPTEKQEMAPLLKPHPPTERLASLVTSSEFKLLSKASLGKMLPLKLSSAVHMSVHPPLSPTRSPTKTQKRPLKLAKSIGLLPTDLPNCIPIATKASREFRPAAVKRGRGIRLHISDEEAYAKIKRSQRATTLPKVLPRTLESNIGQSAPDGGNERNSDVTVAKAKNGESVTEVSEVISRKKSTCLKSELIRQRSSVALPINRLDRIPLPKILSTQGERKNSETNQMRLPQLNIPLKLKTLKSPTPPMEQQFVKGPMKVFGNLAAVSRTTELKGHPISERSKSMPCVVDLNLPFRTLIKRF